MTAKDTLILTTFPVVVESDCENIRKIYPLKQKEVAAIYDVVKSYEEVNRVIVFGSSVTGLCHVGSDLDICIDADVSDGMKIYELQKAIGSIMELSKYRFERAEETLDDAVSLAKQHSYESSVNRAYYSVFML